MTAPFHGLPVASRTLDGVCLSEDSYAAGCRLPRHLHHSAFLSLTLAGGYVERHGGRCVEYAEHAVAFHPVGEEHEVVVGSAELRCLNVELRPEWLEQAGTGMRFVRAVGGPLAWLAHRLHDETRAWGPDARFSAEALVLEMLAVLPVGVTPTCDRLPPRWLAAVDEILHDDYVSPPSVTSLARRVGVHPVHLSRTWRRFRLCSLGDAVRRLRIDEARRRLARSREPILHVALDLGFADQAHFTRIFRRVVGTTPRAWRQATRRR